MTSASIVRVSELQGEALVDDASNVWLPYDLPHLQATSIRWTRLSSHRDVRHAGRCGFQWVAPESGVLHVLNGMGVTLGDSVIGMNALAWLKAKHPLLRIHLYRTRHAPPFVERLYALAGHLVESVTYLPVPLDGMPADVVDLSDFLYWPLFSTEPMVDFFFRGLGMAPESVPATAKSNRWLSIIPPLRGHPSLSAGRYVLFCDQASTPLRTVPPEHAAAMVERIWQRYSLPVLGFHPISHPHYRDVSGESTNLDQFIAWVRSASVVIGTDSSAIHIAAGFNVPTLAMFVSIDPLLRARDYSTCTSLDLRSSLTNGLHASDDPDLLKETFRIWGELLEKSDMPWPSLTGRSPTELAPEQPTWCPSAKLSAIRQTCSIRSSIDRQKD